MCIRLIQNLKGMILSVDSTHTSKNVRETILNEPAEIIAERFFSESVRLGTVRAMFMLYAGKLNTDTGTAESFTMMIKIGYHYTNSFAAKIPTFHSGQRSRIAVRLRTERVRNRDSISGTRKTFFSSP
jgi:hypothetical protein